MYSTQVQREVIQKFIQDELTKRGFHTPITSFEEVSIRGGSTRFEFTTETFQTTPVIFKTLKVGNFSSFISKSEEEGEFSFIINVHVQYSHFDGGRNGCNLFTVRGNFWTNSNQIHVELF